MGEHLAHEHTTSHDPILTKAIPIPIPLVPRLPPPRRHSDDPGRYRPLPRSPPRLFSFAPTRSSPWSPWSPLEQATEGELEEVFGGDAHPESGDKENHGGANHIPLGEGITPSISTSHVRTPSDSTFPFLGAEVDDADEPVFANFASLHEPTFLLPPSRQLGSPSDRMAHTTELLVEERRSRELTVTPLLRRGSELSFTSGYTSRSTSRGSVREMSPDTWTRRMIKHAKVDASVTVQPETASSPPHSGSPLDRGLSPTNSSIRSSPRHNPRPRGHRHTHSTASESLAAHQEQSSPPSLNRRHSDQTSLPHLDLADRSPSEASLAKHIGRGRRASLDTKDLILFNAPTSPLVSPSSPTSDKSERGRSTKLGFAQYAADGYLHLRHSVSLVGSSLRRASHLTSPTRSPVAWSDVHAISVKFRTSQEGSSGVNSFLLGLREMETGGASRAWDPRGLPTSPEPRVEGKRPKVGGKWPTVSSTTGEPSSVLVEFVGGEKKEFSPEGLPPAEIMAFCLQR